jgi:uncharacterized repeat protein (TIGR01451 family)
MNMVKLVIWILAAVLAGSVQAATIRVTTNLDVVAEDGLCSLREALLNHAGADQSGSTDCVAGGSAASTIIIDQSLAGKTIDLGGTALPDIIRNVEIFGPVPGNPDQLTIDAQHDSQIFVIRQAGDVIVQGLTLRRGRMSGPGGAVAITDGAQVVMDRLRILDSEATTSGGAVYLQSSFLILSRSTVAGNVAGSRGGAIDNNNGELRLADVLLSGNVAARGGGVATRGEDSALEIEHSTIASNSAGTSGGGLYIEGGDAILISNSTISLNQAPKSAGIDVYSLVVSPAGTVTLLHTTVARNRASSPSGAGAIGLDLSSSSPTQVQLVNSLLIQDRASETACDDDGRPASLVNIGSLASDASCHTAVAAPADFMIGPLIDNGGSAPTHMLHLGSVAINAGGDCPADQDLSVDQRREPRPGAGSTACDLGAVEVQGPPTIFVPASDLGLDITTSVASAAPDDLIDIALTAENLALDFATGVKVQVQIPAGLELLAATPGQGSFNPAAGIWTIDELPVNVPVELALQLKMLASGTSTLTAEVFADQDDPDPGNNSALVEITRLSPRGPSIVDTTLDVLAEDGLCSLREAIINTSNNDQSGSTDCARGGLSPDLILFDDSLVGATITLAGEPLPSLIDDVIVQGPVEGNPAGLVIDGDSASRILDIRAGAEVSIRNLSLINSRLSEAFESGGGVRIEEASNVLMESVRLTGHQGDLESNSGAAILVWESSLQLVDCEISGNSTGGAGAGILAIEAILTLSGCSVSQNQAFAGSAIYGSGTQVLIDHSTIAENQAVTSGSIYYVGGPFTLRNSTVSSNLSGEVVGGLLIAPQSVVLEQVTMANNHASAPAENLEQWGVSDHLLMPDLGTGDDIPLIMNGVLFVNEGSPNPGCILQTATPSVENSLGTDSSCTGTAATAAEIDLQPLADNGGPTRTHALGEQSVALDAAGDCGLLGIDSDQRGLPRPGSFTPACDIGAYERQGLPPETDLSITKTAVPAVAEPGDTVTFSIWASNLGPAAATGVRVTDVLPAGFDFVSAGATIGSYDVNSGLWTLGNLSDNQGALLQIIVTVNPAGPYANTATVTSDMIDPEPGNNSATAMVTVSGNEPEDQIFSDRFEL